MIFLLIIGAVAFVITVEALGIWAFIRIRRGFGQIRS